MEELAKVGMTAKASKSSILCNEPESIGAYEWPDVADDSETHRERCAETARLFAALPEAERAARPGYVPKYPAP